MARREAAMTEPDPIGELLDRVLGGLGAPAGRRSASLFDAWDDIVGPAIAAHARPLALTQGALRIGVDDPVWATELRFRKDELLGRLDAALGDGAVTAIEITVRL